MHDDNKRIAKNTLFLYSRMIFSLVISFYTSRLILETLGVENYGIYNIVAGVIVMFGFLNASMSGATSRFLTFELGKGTKESLFKTFTAALSVHFIIAGIILLLAETVGLWWLNNKIVINQDKLFAAQWVYQFSVISAIISIILVPFYAMIIAHEKMNISAILEVVNSLLKLGVTILLIFVNYDKLILYSFLLLCVAVIIAIAYIICCLRILKNYKYKLEWDKTIIYPMLNFSAWDLYGNVSVIAKTQGVNMLLNSFFGVFLNAAYGIANQVQGAITSFSSSFLSAVQPQIVKYFASGELNRMRNLMNNATKLAFILIFLLELPFILECNFILHIWLKEVPNYALKFTQLNLVSNIIYVVSAPMLFAIHATGRIKSFSFISGTIYLMVLPFSYVFFKMGFSPIIPYILNVIMMIIYYFSITIVLQYLLPQLSYKFISLKNLFLCLIAVFFGSVIQIYLHYLLTEGWIRLLLVCFLSMLLIPISGYFILFDKSMRVKIFNLIMNKLNFILKIFKNKSVIIF